MKNKAMNNNGFQCEYCGKWIEITEFMGTEHRNHCPFCLWSKHVDLDEPGDRKAKCKAKMKPIGLTFKHEGLDKYGKPKQREIMLIHECTGCEGININRLAGDDDSSQIINILDESQNMSAEKREKLNKQDIKILNNSDREEVNNQLFGKRL